MKRCTWIKTVVAILLLQQAVLLSNSIADAKIGSLSFRTWKTQNGMQVLFAPTDELKIIDLRLVFDAGGARDGERYGLAQLTNALIYEGSKDITAEAIADTFDSLGVSYGNGSYRDMAILEFRLLSRDDIRNRAFDTILDILKQPLFGERAFHRERKTMQLALKKVEESASLKAGRAFYHQIYDGSGKNAHPYAFPPSGTEKSLQQITRDDLKLFYQQYYVAGNAVLAVVGDIDEARLRVFAEHLSQALGDGAHAPALPEVHRDKKGERVTIAHESTQTTIIMGMPVLKRGDPDYYALYLGNHILGGSGFSSRLVKEVRVKRGLTYGISSSFSQMREAGPFSISLTTKNSSVKEAVMVITQQLRQFIEQGPTEAELQQAKLNISGSFPLRTMSNKSIVSHLAVIGFYQLPHNYLDIFLDKIQALTLRDVKDAFRRRIKEQHLSTIIVGAVDSLH